jgi:hypothetical protein
MRTLGTSHARRLLVLVATVCAVTLAACTEEPPTAPESPFTGTWTLETVNGAPLPRVFEVLIDGTRRSVVGGALIVRSRGRLDDTRRQVQELSNGTRLDDATDTTTSPFSATATEIYIRRYGLRAEDDWVDTGTYFGGTLQLRARYLEPRFRTVRNVTLTFRRQP